MKKLSDEIVNHLENAGFEVSEDYSANEAPTYIKHWEKDNRKYRVVVIAGTIRYTWWKDRELMSAGGLEYHDYDDFCDKLIDVFTVLLKK